MFLDELRFSLTGLLNLLSYFVNPWITKKGLIDKLTTH